MVIEAATNRLVAVLSSSDPALCRSKVFNLRPKNILYNKLEIYLLQRVLYALYGRLIY